MWLFGVILSQCELPIRCLLRKRSTKSLITTALIELTPESTLDMAAANIPETTSPETPKGNSCAM